MNSASPRILVTIASFGEKNRVHLKNLIDTYHGMSMPIDIVVVTEAQRDIDPAVRVVAGLPSKNPWSLPFAHKAIMAEKIADYDLFIYSEDDVRVTEQNIRAFLRVLPDLQPDEIPGFLRYEAFPDGSISYPEIHGPFHWIPQSVAKRGAEVIAQFSNEHAALYILTRAQLQRAVKSGGFLREPYAGRYDMLCAAATDPYTSCGFRKILCVSSIDDFLVHHLPNRYAGLLGIDEPTFREQIATLLAIANDTHPRSSLCETESRMWGADWSKNFYEEPREEIVETVVKCGSSVLSIGCGSGATELCLKQKGLEVTAIPLDSVIGATAARNGFEVVHGNGESALAQFDGRIFDCVLLTNLLHLQPDPLHLLAAGAALLAPGGSLVTSGPNFSPIQPLLRRWRKRGDYKYMRSFARSGIHPSGRAGYEQLCRRAGLKVTDSRWLHSPTSRPGQYLRSLLPRLLAPAWLLRATK